jgi:hypothetical protein
VLAQDFQAGLAQPGTVLLQARQHDLVAIIHVSAAEAGDISRASIVLLLCKGRRRQQDERYNKKVSGHDVMPPITRPVSVVICSNHGGNAFVPPFVSGNTQITFGSDQICDGSSARVGEALTTISH